jgi:hypothetical protein
MHLFTPSLIPKLGLLGFAWLAVSCQSPDRGSSSRYLAAYGPTTERQVPSPGDPGAALPDDISYWAGDGIRGNPKIRINPDLQKAFFYKDDVLVGVSRISTGKEGNGTPSGSYKITQKNRDHSSNLYGVIRDKATGMVLNDDADARVDPVPPGAEFVGAPMPNFMRFNGGIGMHTGYLPGYNASHGCVRMPDKMAKKFFEHAPVGTPVIVD